MRFVSLLILFIGFLSHSRSFAQSSDLFIFRDIQQAYANGTRSKDGKPGSNYWQNRSDYRINVTLEPTTRTIRGEATITYTNNSPDALEELVLRLYPDIFKKGAIRDEAVSPEDVTEGVAITKLAVNGKNISMEGGRPQAVRSGTNLRVKLNSPLASKKQATVNVAWNYTIPKETHIREGFYGKSSFFVAYWYPQIAVYDDISGWDTFNYTGTQEFYNDFGNFDVSVTVPEDYLVWATGVLGNINDVLSPDYAAKYKSAQTSDDVINIVQASDLKKGNITKKGSTTWQFRAEYVPDFAFAVSNEYLWDATSVVVDKSSGRRVTVGAAYNPDAKDFYEVAKYGRQSVDYFSSQLPGVPFPYPNLTVFNGSGGMEFPMMVNDGSFPTLADAAEVTAHEIAHTYFPFYMGINERKYAWMDEGWAQFLPNGIAFQTDKKNIYNPQKYNARVYAGAAGRELEMPLMVPSVLMTGQTYGIASYFRPAQAYEFLQDMLGKVKFKQVLQEYMRRWNGKHPTPYDFFFTFNDAAGENLNWYWKPWFFEMGYPDLAVQQVTEENGSVQIIVANAGNIPIPVDLAVTLTDGSVKKVHYSAAVWKDGQPTFTVKIPADKPVKSVQLGGLLIPDAIPDNNAHPMKD